jgi:UDP-N-acetylglucosamine transferase subunit ALG13
MDQSIKLFVILGTQKFPFNRLIKALDELVEKKIYRGEDILIQANFFDYFPKFAKYIKLISLDEFNIILFNADIVITHSGVNSIISCIKQQKKFIIIPRLKQFGEHVDDHQLEIANIMRKQFDVLVVDDLKDLPIFIKKSLTHIYKPWNFNNQALLNSIKEFIEIN